MNTPWYLSPDADHDTNSGIDGELLLDKNLGEIGTIKSTEHAQHIVKCVNAYQELVGALRKVINIVDEYGQDSGPLSLRDIAQEALLAAGETL